MRNPVCLQTEGKVGGMVNTQKDFFGQSFMVKPDDSGQELHYLPRKE